VQRVFAEELGFCSLHTWQLADISSIRGLSIGYVKLLERLAGNFADLATRKGTNYVSGSAAVPSPQTPRPANSDRHPPGTGASRDGS
jgi:hypothetical protein